MILFSGNMDQAVVAYEPEVTDAYRRSFFKVYKNGGTAVLPDTSVTFSRYWTGC